MVKYLEDRCIGSTFYSFNDIRAIDVGQVSLKQSCIPSVSLRYNCTGVAFRSIDRDGVVDDGIKHRCGYHQRARS
jgi:hypothetical protein